jgi:hypothetical protein
MTQYSKENYISLYNTTFEDNTIGAISEGDMRQFVQDTADSVGAGLFSTKVTISSAQILALNSTPQVLIAAGGAGTIIQVVNLTLYLDYGTVAYATNLNLQTYLGTMTPTNNLSASILASTADNIYQNSSISFSDTLANTVNQPLYLKVNTGNPTAGDSPLYVYVTYRIITL